MWIRAGLAILACASATTVAWIVVGLLTPGDYWANGSWFALPFLALAAGAGAFLGAKVRRRAVRIVVIVAGTLSGLFWTTVPSGWWAKGPPPAASPVGLRIRRP